MVWRGSTDIKDRIFSALVYLIPLYYAWQFGVIIRNQLPILNQLSILFFPLDLINQSVPFASFILFIVLYMAVVRNPRVPHFIRFNAMQSILLDILVYLCSLLLQVAARGLGGNIIIQTLFSTLFLGVFLACGYSIIQSLMGRYPELPGISEAAYIQVR